MKIYIGTTNFDKVREISSMTAYHGIDVETISLDVEETGDSFEACAKQKAFAYAKALPNEVVLSEDSGLVIPSIDGLPGVCSARFYGYDISSKKIDYNKFKGLSREGLDSLNRKKVLHLMENIEQPYRFAQFIISMILVKNDKVLFSDFGKMNGWISPEEKGTNGFGYDSIFIGEETYGLTLAEIDSYRKNLKSHRKQVIKKLDLWLASNKNVFQTH